MDSEDWGNIPRTHLDHIADIRDWNRLESLSQEVIQDGIEAYFNSFHAQPYALFVQPVDFNSLGTVVLNPMLALSIRCSLHPFWTSKSVLQSATQALSERSWQQLLRLYGEGATDLEYLQGLCLLAQVDFAGMESSALLRNCD
jgi:hypothetical protein